MSTGFEISLKAPRIRDITANQWHDEPAFPVGISETHEVNGQVMVANNELWGVDITVTVKLWLQDPMGTTRGYKEQTFVLGPADWVLMPTERVVLDVPGRWRLQASYHFLGWNWTRTWDAIDCQVIEHTLILTSQNGGSIQAYVAGQEITVGPGQTRTIEGIPRRSTVGLQAFPSSGYTFRRWTGAPVNGDTSTMVQFEMLNNYSITASWEQQAVEPGVIEGVVMENETGQPISGATVQSGSYTTTTNSSGAYQITGIPAGQYTFIYSKSGYWTEQRDVLIQSGQTTKLDVALKEANGNGNGNGEEGEGEILKYALIGGGIILVTVLVRSALKRGGK